MNIQRIYKLRELALKQKEKRGYIDHLLLLELINLTFEEYADKDVGFWDHFAGIMSQYFLGVKNKEFVDQQYKTATDMFCVYHRN